jgi:predicted HAD superfamily Cof-like phosphohydrolase
VNDLFADEVGEPSPILDIVALRKENKQLNENLTSVQKRCTELLEENRELRRRLSSYKGLARQVAEFHVAMGQPIEPTPTVPSDERVRLRARLIAEEFFETLESLFDSLPNALDEAKYYTGRVIGGSEVRVNFPEFIDGLADLDYVIEGTRLEFGVDGGPIAAEVHHANMRKVGGKQREDGKFLKPEGWEPPDIAGELRKQGWEPLPLADETTTCCSTTCGVTHRHEGDS